MNIEEFNPDNKIVFHTRGYESAGYSFRMMLDTEAIAYHSSDDSQFSNEDQVLYFTDTDYPKVQKMYEKFIADFLEQKSEPDFDISENNADEQSYYRIRKDVVIIFLALIVLFFGITISYLFYK